MRGTRYYNDKTDTCSRVEKVESGPDDSRLIGQEMRTRHSDEENEKKKTIGRYMSIFTLSHNRLYS